MLKNQVTTLEPTLPKSPATPQSFSRDLSYSLNFAYSHDNPYHNRLEAYKDFIFRDHEAESFKSQWNQIVFEREAPLHLEIGTGAGQFMREFCLHHPEINFLGMDYRFKRSFQLAKQLEKLEQKNFRYLRAKAERLGFMFGPSEIDTAYLFFPDPWPKNRHHKKRLVNASFLEVLYKVLKPGGKFFIKTDHDCYYQWMLKAFVDQSHLFQLAFKTDNLREEHPQHFLSSFETNFEKIFLQQNIKIKAMTLISLKPSFVV